MSYCRWSEDCPWYVYWRDSLDASKEGQLVEICGEGVYSYRYLAENFDEIIKDLSIRPEWDRNPTKKEMDILAEVLKEFIDDVDFKFSQKE